MRPDRNILAFSAIIVCKLAHSNFGGKYKRSALLRRGYKLQMDFYPDPFDDKGCEDQNPASPDEGAPDKAQDQNPELE